jgi:hypothetical protein
MLLGPNEQQLDARADVHGLVVLGGCPLLRHDRMAFVSGCIWISGMTQETEPLADGEVTHATLTMGQSSMRLLGVQVDD